MKNPLDLPIKNYLLKFSFEKITRFDGIKQIYQNWLDNPNNQHGVDGKGLLSHGLTDLDVSLDVNNLQYLENIPKEGPLVFVANHPLGGLDGMLLAQLILKFRPDLKVLTNELLLTFPEFSELFIGVDVLNPNKQKQNAKGILKLSKHLSGQGAVLIFPAGIVSSIKLPNLSIQEQAWHPMVARLIQKHKANCLPIYVHDRNSITFYLSGLIHKRLRTILLARAMLSKKHSLIKVNIGQLLKYQDFEHTKDTSAITEYLQLCCQSLKDQYKISTNKSQLRQNKIAALKKDINIENLVQQHLNLESYKLLDYKDLSVYCAPYGSLGCVMEQISISRERTFRQVDEGTGRELDCDIYDPFYWHLWVWDNNNKKIVGGYRLAKVDEIIKNHGIKKLYSHSLYSYDRAFIQSLQHSVEVGRSFITPEYQRHPRALDLLWKGIGRYMKNNSKYHTLFGCVSISQQYSNLARALLADTLIHHYAVEKSISKMVNPRKPLNIQNKPWSDKLLPSLTKIPIINKLIGKIDSGKGIAIRIRH